MKSTINSLLLIPILLTSLINPTKSRSAKKLTWHTHYPTIAKHKYTVVLYGKTWCSNTVEGLEVFKKFSKNTNYINKKWVEFGWVMFDEPESQDPENSKQTLRHQLAHKKRIEITGYPTILLWKDERMVSKFKGERSESGFKRWLERAIENTDDKYRPVTKRPPKKTLPPRRPETETPDTPDPTITETPRTDIPEVNTENYDENECADEYPDENGDSFDEEKPGNNHETPGILTWLRQAGSPGKIKRWHAIAGLLISLIVVTLAAASFVHLKRQSAVPGQRNDAIWFDYDPYRT